jgi:hypothetical protein
MWSKLRQPNAEGVDLSSWRFNGIHTGTLTSVRMLYVWEHKRNHVNLAALSLGRLIITFFDGGFVHPDGT